MGCGASTEVLASTPPSAVEALRRKEEAEKDQTEDAARILDNMTKLVSPTGGASALNRGKGDGEGEGLREHASEQIAGQAAVVVGMMQTTQSMGSSLSHFSKKPVIPGGLVPRHKLIDAALGVRQDLQMLKVAARFSGQEVKTIEQATFCMAFGDMRFQKPSVVDTSGGVKSEAEVDEGDRDRDQDRGREEYGESVISTEDAARILHNMNPTGAS